MPKISSNTSHTKGAYQSGSVSTKSKKHFSKKKQKQLNRQANRAQHEIAVASRGKTSSIYAKSSAPSFLSQVNLSPGALVKRSWLIGAAVLAGQPASVNPPWTQLSGSSNADAMPESASVNTKPAPTRAEDKKAFLKDVLRGVQRDIKEIREIRPEYNRNSKAKNAQYNTIAAKVTACFINQHGELYKAAQYPPKPIVWNHKKATLDVHQCALKFNYPNIAPIDQRWRSYVEGQRSQNAILFDLVGLSANELTYLTKATGVTKIGDASLERKVASPRTALADIKLTLDNKDVVYLKVGADPNSSGYNLRVFRAPLVRVSDKTSPTHSDCNTMYPEPVDVCFRNNGLGVEKQINALATKLLNGEFKDQKEAETLLVKYKVLSCLTFAIEEMKGSQFNNIVKANVIVESIKTHFPEKIDPHFQMPHIHRNPEFQTTFFANPEMAAVIEKYMDFANIEADSIARATKKAKAASQAKAARQEEGPNLRSVENTGSNFKPVTKDRSNNNKSTVTVGYGQHKPELTRQAARR